LFQIPGTVEEISRDAVGLSGHRRAFLPLDERLAAFLITDQEVLVAVASMTDCVACCD